jgi:putative ABC transport system substrate-binding protein
VRKTFRRQLRTSRSESPKSKPFIDLSRSIPKIKFLALGASLLVFGFSADAQQQRKVHRLGILRSGISNTTGSQDTKEAFLQGLRELGWVEGQNLAVEYRYAEGKFERPAGLALELTGLPVDVIYAGDFNSALAAKQATKTIPIVFVTLGDAVQAGLVASLPRPGENLTGVSGLGPELSGKRLELLKEVVPGLTRVAFLTDPANVASAPTLRVTETAAQSLKVELQVIKVTKPHQLEEAFSAMKKSQANALMVNHDPTLRVQRDRILNLVEKSRLPAIYVETAWVPDGGLMSYAPNLPDQNRRAATYVDKILRGVKAADLPVEQPTKFELVINLKAAKQIGLTIPPNVLARADRVIK